MTRLVFLDVDDTLLTPPYEAIRRVSTFFGKKFPPEEAFLNRPHVDYFEAFPGLFKSKSEMWAIALLSLPFGHFRSQSPMPFDVERVGKLLQDQRLYLISKNPPSFTRWRIMRLRALFGVAMGDRYIACGPMLKKGPTKLSVLSKIAAERGVPLRDCLLVDDSAENIREAAAAEVQCALVRSSWNNAEADALQKLGPHVAVIDTQGIADAVAGHLDNEVRPDRRPTFFVPPLTVMNSMRLAGALLRRWWLFSERLPSWKQIVPVARNPLLSYFCKDPHKKICARMAALIREPQGLHGARILALTNGAQPRLLPTGLAAQLSTMPEQEATRHLRTVCRDALAARGHTFVRDAKFYFRALLRPEEKARILSSKRIEQAKNTYLQTHDASPAQAEKLLGSYVEELLTSRTYVSCMFGEWVLDTLLARVMKKIHLETHPRVRELEHDHFLFYASTHRSYLDSAVLWSLLSHNGQSFPFAVGADKMRTVWFGRLGARGGTFFLRRKFIDVMYAAVIAEHITSMQEPGSVIEVFLEGQRSRSGLTLPPKKGIASMVWENMEANSKVAVVPVSFTYNKLPESEKLIKERFDERKKLGLVSLREQSDMKIRLARRKSFLEKVRSSWRRLRHPLVSECYVHFAEPIVLDKSARDASLQQHLNEAMQRINVATAILPSSLLCLYLLGAPEGHTTAELAAGFLKFSKAVVGLYELPAHLDPFANLTTPEADVQAFTELPFVNRKFKRAGMVERSMICIDDLDIERASYYKNNVLHFFVLPAILSYVLTDVHSGRIEELHRCFDQMFGKLQATYFLPSVASTSAFIDAFLAILASDGLIAVADKRWVINDEKANAELLTVLSRLGAQLVQGDLPDLLDTIRRSTKRTDVNVPSRLAALETRIHSEAKMLGLSSNGFYVQCDAPAALHGRVEFVAASGDAKVSGVIVRVDEDGVAVRHDPPRAPAQGEDAVATERRRAARSSQVYAGSATFEHAQSGTGIIKNLSPSGAFIATDLCLQIGNELRCSLGEQEDSFVVRGRVARITQAGVGVCFEGLNDEGRARLVLLSVHGKEA